MVSKMNVKYATLVVSGALGTTISGIFGGFSEGFKCLLICMIIDIITGIICSLKAKSEKTETGTLSSKALWTGLCRKVTTIALIAMSYQIDQMLGDNTIIRDAVIIAFMCNEALSIVENAGLIGIPIPSVITKAIDVLNKKSDDSSNSISSNIVNITDNKDNTDNEEEKENGGE